MDYELMMNGTVKLGQKAPEFQAETTFGDICLDDYQGKWLVLFSHPGDFTPVYSYNLGKVEKNMKMPDIAYCFLISIS